MVVMMIVVMLLTKMSVVMLGDRGVGDDDDDDYGGVPGVSDDGPSVGDHNDDYCRSGCDLDQRGASLI